MTRRIFGCLTSGAMIVVMTYTPLLGAYTGTVAAAQTVPEAPTSAGAGNWSTAAHKSVSETSRKASSRTISNAVIGSWW